MQVKMVALLIVVMSGAVPALAAERHMMPTIVPADKLDEDNPGEGIFGLIVLSLRSSLKLKDENIKLEVKIAELEREIKRVKKNQGARK